MFSLFSLSLFSLVICLPLFLFSLTLCLSFSSCLSPLYPFLILYITLPLSLPLFLSISRSYIHSYLSLSIHLSLPSLSILPAFPFLSFLALALRPYLSHTFPCLTMSLLPFVSSSPSYTLLYCSHFSLSLSLSHYLSISVASL